MRRFCGKVPFVVPPSRLDWAVRLGAKRSRELGKTIANGADIAADPTLTGAWTSLAPMLPANLPHPRSGACLAPDVWPRRDSISRCSAWRDCSPALAPASGFRSCTAASLEARSLRHPRPCALAGPRPCPFTDPGLRRIRTCVLLHHPIRPGSRPVRWRCFAAVSNEADLPLAEASRMPSLDRGVDSCHRHPWDKNPGNFKALRLSVPVASCPEDRLKVRPVGRSGNIGTRDFSTSAPIACGREWISQRFIAFVKDRAGRVERNRPETVILALRQMLREAVRLARGRRQTSRLRRASSRSRSPFSLMKPSASFWS